MRNMRRNAFSLVELSIVLVILGLLVGGILAGQSLIRASEIRAITTVSEQYKSALYAFRDKYFALPGDMANATKFWDVLGGDGANDTCQLMEATGRPTCNGDGNNLVDTSSLTTFNYAERFRFWQHLANAGLVEGTYTGRSDSSTAGSFVLNPGKNVPRLKDGGSYDPYSVSILSNLGTAGGFDFAGSMKYGTLLLAYRGPNAGKPLTPAEIWSIDTKLDDGRPAYGIILGPQASWTGSPNCTTSDTPSLATYDLQSDERKCRYNFLVWK